MRTIPKFSYKQFPKNKRIGLFIFAVLILVLIIILSQVLISLLIIERKDIITSSMLQSIDGPSTNYKRLTVDVYLHNPSGSRRTTVWVEITNQVTNISFSKCESVQIEYKQSKKIDVEFILDKLVYPGEFVHRVWLTYPNSQH